MKNDLLGSILDKIIFFVPFAFVAAIIVAVIWDRTMNKPVTITFAGDTMLGRMVNEKIGEDGYKYPLGTTIPVLYKGDLNIVNLETTLTKSNKKVSKAFNFKAYPDRVETLKAGRIDAVNLANNHIMDFSKEGLIETIETLDKAGIKHVGAGRNIEEARKPVIIEKNRIKIGIIGYTDNEPRWRAKSNSPGTNFLKVGDIEKVKNDVNLIRDKVNLVVVTIHWGPNMREHPSEDFIKFAHEMIDAGVDIIHGHSAHIFQGVEVYKNKLIMYDTGDFVDDYHVTPHLRNDRSFLFQVTANKIGVIQLKFIPILISNMQANIATGKELVETLVRMKKLSEKLGTKIGNDSILEIPANIKKP